MKKYFLFRKEQPNVDSTVVDDSGDRVSVFAVPGDSLAFMSSEYGQVVFVFNNTTVYEDNNLTDGESMKKTSISVECELGEEFKLIEDVLGFLSRESQTGRNIMRFDAIGESTFSTGAPRVTSPKKPVKRGSQKPSNQSFIGSSDAFTVSSATVIAGVDFEDADNMPLVDYNEKATDFDGFSDGAEITAWKNDTKATGGTAYDITSNVGTPKIAFADTRLATKYVDSLASGSGDADYFVIPTIDIKGPYTLYMVFGAQISTLGTIPGKIYSDEEVDCFGFSVKNTADSIELRHDGVSGSPATASLSKGSFPATGPDGTTGTVAQSFVIRRDANYNISIYGYQGDLEAYIPAVVSQATKDETDKASTPNYATSATLTKTSSPSNTLTVGNQGRTDGNLRITRLGDGADGTTTTSKQFWSRFGVIAKDVGADLASKIATQLHTHYQP